MSHKLGICIPYRNRKEHIDKLIPKLSEHLTNKGIDHTFYVGHQVDDKLFNRGAMKNIAAHYAFEDGCDYVAWHDVDMVPFPDADYSYPIDNPTHIATKLSKYNYGMGYDQYFGGVVLFNKEQAYQTNGYSNDYWDWGQEDDDLFWRCYFESMTTGKVFKGYENKTYAEFNGISSKIEIPCTRELVSCLNKDHTISILFYAEQQPELVPIWLVGDEQRKFIEYPIFRKCGGYNYGISFNNSRALTMSLFNDNKMILYNYLKRFEKLWTWVTLTYNSNEKKIFFYLNNDYGRHLNGINEREYFPILSDNLLKYDNKNPFYLGHDENSNTYFKGKIAEVKIYNKFFSHEEIEKVFETNDDGLILHHDFTKMYGSMIFDTVSEHISLPTDVEFGQENIEVIENILPYRRDGNFYCLSHIDEGFVNGKWAKGETTARNEKRFVTEMQQNKIDYKTDGLKQVLDTLNVVEVDDSLYPNTKFINVTMK